MSLRLLYMDELKGFYRSNVMLILWIALPLISLATYFFLPKDNQMSISVVTSGMISALGGWLAAIMLASHIIHEKSHHVYALFLIRPVKRREILLSKFFAVFTCVSLACIFSLLLSFGADYFFIQRSPQFLIGDTVESLVVSLSIIAMECAAGALIGVLVSSILVGILLVIVSHNISSLTVMLPLMVHMPHGTIFTAVCSLGVSVLFLFLAFIKFDREQF